MAWMYELINTSAAFNFRMLMKTKTEIEEIMKNSTTDMIVECIALAQQQSSYLNKLICFGKRELKRRRKDVH